MTRRVARNRLLGLWLTATSLLFLFVTAQAIGGKYGVEWQAGYLWLAWSFIPTLLFIIIISLISINADRNNIQVEKLDLYRCCWWASIFYLAVTGAVPLVEPSIDTKIEDLFEVSPIACLAFQAFVTVLI